MIYVPKAISWRALSIYAGWASDHEDAPPRCHTYPIVQHFLERMGVSDIIRSCVGGSRELDVHHGEAICVLVHNLVQSPGPLYRAGDWAAPWKLTCLD